MPIIVLSSILVISSFLISPLTAPQSSTNIAESLPTSEVKAVKEIPPLGLSVKGAVVVDNDSNQQVISYQEDKEWSIASLTKLMSALVYMDQNPDFNQVIAFEKKDMVEGSALKVPVGTKFRAGDLLHASLMSSANNATLALARGTGMTREEFVSKMNEKAKSMGLENTTFTEPTGLDPANRSTPEEYAKVVNETFKHPILKSILQTTQYTLRPLNHYPFTIGNTNKLLGQNLNYEVVAGKTGFTYGSAYNFAAQVKKDGKQITIIVFGDKTFTQSFESAKELADAALSGEEQARNQIR